MAKGFSLNHFIFSDVELTEVWPAGTDSNAPSKLNCSRWDQRLASRVLVQVKILIKGHL